MTKREFLMALNDELYPQMCIRDRVVPGITSLVAGALRRIVPVRALMLTTGGNTGVEIDIDNPAERCV